MSRFRADDIPQRQIRDAVLGPQLYGPHSTEGRYVYLDKGKMATLLQKRCAVDTVMQGDNGRALFVEEKIVRWPGYAYSQLTLETRSCTVKGHESPGWMAYGKADLLNYVLCQEDGNLLCLIMNFSKLKAKFWPEAESFEKTVTDQFNHTECCKVPLTWVRRNVGYRHVLLEPTPEARPVVLGFNTSHYRNGDDDWNRKSLGATANRVMHDVNRSRKDGAA